MEWVAIWIGAAVVVGLIAGRIGIGGWQAFFVSLFLSPIIGGVLVAVGATKRR